MAVPMAPPSSIQILELFEASSWACSFGPQEQARALDDLEQDRLLFFPQLAFPLASSERSV